MPIVKHRAPVVVRHPLTDQYIGIHFGQEASLLPVGARVSYAVCGRDHSLAASTAGAVLRADGSIRMRASTGKAVIDIATLTGAVLVALGQSTAGLFGNDRELVGLVKEAAQATDEPVWQLPLEKSYRKLLDSNVADMRNIGGPYGGAITAALFLSEFVGEVPWAHLDIAGTMNVARAEARARVLETGADLGVAFDAAVDVRTRP